MGKGSLAKGTLAERIRGDAQVERVRRAHAGTILCRLLAQLRAREQDKFAAHLYPSVLILTTSAQGVATRDVFESPS